MTNDEIKELAWTAGATIRHTAGLFQLSDYRATHFGFSLEALAKFAELIQARAVPDGHVVVVPDRRLVSAGGTEKIAGYILTKGGWQDYFLTKMVLKRFAPTAAQNTPSPNPSKTKD